MKRHLATLLSLLFLAATTATPVFANGAPWCVVTSFQSFCYYYDISSCQSAARSQRGMCVPNPDR